MSQIDVQSIKEKNWSELVSFTMLIDAELKAEVKQRALSKRQKLREYIIDALVEKMQREDQAAQ